MAAELVWPLLDLFFDSEMHRQQLVPGAAEALAAIGRQADIVILTNIGDQYRAKRVAQLEAFDIRHRVLCNRGGKGGPVVELIEEMRPAVAVFVDDLAVHHESVARARARRLPAAHDRRAPPRRPHAARARTPMPGSTNGTGPCPGFSRSSQ